MAIFVQAMECLILLNPASISTHFKVFLPNLLASLYLSSSFGKILAILSLILQRLDHFGGYSTALTIFLQMRTIVPYIQHKLTFFTCMCKRHVLFYSVMFYTVHALQFVMFYTVHALQFEWVYNIFHRLILKFTQTRFNF